ncbi:MAG: PEGA domain-containing protein [Patescibacteria group bacterium]|jgi:hypothetical protein
MADTPPNQQPDMTPLPEGVPQPVAAAPQTPTSVPANEDSALAAARSKLETVTANTPNASPDATTQPKAPDSPSTPPPSAGPTTQDVPQQLTPPAPTSATKRSTTASSSWRLYALGAVGVLVIGAALFFFLYWPATLTVRATPETTMLNLGSTSGTGALTTKLRPGSYTVTGTLPGYHPFTTTVTLGMHETRELAVGLREIPNAARLSEQRVQHLALSTEDENPTLLFLEPHTGVAYRLFTKNPAQPVSERITPDTLRNVEELRWSPNRQLALIRQDGRIKLYDFKRYDLVNQTVTEWPAELRAIAWRPDGEKVAYVFHGGDGERTIIRAGKDNSEPERIFNLKNAGLDNPSIEWSPDGKQLSLLENEKLYTLDVLTATLSAVRLEGVRGASWLPTSDRLIASTAQSGQFVIVPLDGEPTALSQTGQIDELVATKDGSRIIHARLNQGNVAFEAIELATNTVTPYVLSAGLSIQPKHLILSPDEQTLYFTSAGQPYALTLDTGIYDSNEN